MKYWLVGTILLAASGAVWAENELDCENALTTPEVNRCLARDADAAEATMTTYLEASRERLETQTEALAGLDKAQAAWENYRDTHCSAIYSYWQSGTIRGAMFTGCRINLAQERTHALWRSYIQPMDSSEPMMPEPERP